MARDRVPPGLDQLSGDQQWLVWASCHLQMSVLQLPSCRKNDQNTSVF